MSNKIKILENLPPNEAIFEQKPMNTDESEIQEVNPPKTVAPPPTAATAEWRFACEMENRSLYQYN